MNKFLPFVFPVIALLVIGFLTYRWYAMNTPEREGQVSQFGEGVSIDNLSANDQQKMLLGATDAKTVELTGEGEQAAEVRYELKESKVNFSVMAVLAEPEVGYYQVWLQSPDAQDARRAFVLAAGKGGFIGSASVPESLLPFQVVISREQTTDDTLEEIVLKGTLTKE